MSAIESSRGWNVARGRRASSAPASRGHYAVIACQQPEQRPRLRVQQVQGLAIVTFIDAAVLFEASHVAMLGKHLYRLVKQGQTRMLLDLGGVRYMSCAMLGKLAGLHVRIERARGVLWLCGLAPELMDMLRICHLERVLDTFSSRAEALRAAADGEPLAGPPAPAC
jgi:anti-anti-sigma factor